MTDQSEKWTGGCLCGAVTYESKGSPDKKTAAMRALLVINSILLACVFGPMASAQGDLEVDVELVIAVDVSRSMTPRVSTPVGNWPTWPIEN